MSLRESVRTVLLLVVAVGYGPSAGAAEAVDWLRGAGNELELRLRAEVFGADGLPAEHIQVTGGTAGIRVGSTAKLSPRVEGHRFETWIPVNKTQPQYLWIKAAKLDGSQAAYLKLQEREFRQSAIDGITLRLQPPTRHVVVQVTFNGTPVAGAHVKADLGFGIDERARTDDTGIARFALQPQLSLFGLTAWTDDFRIGGFSFDRKPIRDPKADQHIVELTRCRDQSFRLVDEHGAPVPGIDFVVQMATPKPNPNFVGTNEHSRITTDAAGEATYKWLPDWKECYFYIDLDSLEWVPERDHHLVDGVVVFRVKRTRLRDRKPVAGRIVSTSTRVEGFHVTMMSFQGERERSHESLSAFTDVDGRFSINVLPDATYCCFVTDSRWVSDSIDLIPFQSTSARVTTPKLTVSEGQLVEVRATLGPHRRPYPNLTIGFHREHKFSWLQNFEIRNGISGPMWGQPTDLSGRMSIRVLPGVLRVGAHTQSWREDQKIEIRPGEPIQIRVHREIDEKRTITGRLALADDVRAELSGAEIQVASVDGNYDDEPQTFKCSDDGTFSFEMMASQIGIFARTRDGSAAGALIVRSRDSTADIVLRPTMDFRGQLLSEDGRPLARHRVWASVSVDANRTSCTNFATVFEVQHLETMTDEQGNFTVTALPANMEISVAAAVVENPDTERVLGRVYLESGMPRAREIFRLSTIPDDRGPVPLAERYQTLLRDCSLSAYHLMVIVPGSGESVDAFIDQNLMDADRNRDAYAFLYLRLPAANAAVIEDVTFLRDRDWIRPPQDKVFVCAIASDGRELARAEFDVTNTSAAASAAEFVHHNAAPQRDAEQKWREVFAEAQRSGRRVWARVSQRNCAPCFQMSRWLDDHREVLAKDFVILKIDEMRDLNAAQVSQRLTSGEEQGVPFHAIFDVDGRMLIDSAGPLGNIGCPAGAEGKKHLRKMLMQTRRNLADHEIDQLVESVGD